MPYLEVKTKQGSKRLKLEDEPITVGRLPENTLVVNDDRTSRRHCVIEPVNGAWRVRDLGSANGTKINNERVNEHYLDNGDVVRVGGAHLCFINVDGQAAEQSQPRNTPDFDQALEDFGDPATAATLDVDLHAEVSDAQPNYERKLREIADAAPDKPFNEDDIALVDCRGVTLHQANSAGLESGTESESQEGTRVFRLLLLAAFRSRATDMHIEPRLDSANVRLRVDGYMINAVDLSMNIFRRILGIIKILCQVDTSQKSTVQDGHFSVVVKSRRVDYRVSLTPAVNGQKIVVRVLDSRNAPSRLHELGLLPWMYEKLRVVATKDAGMLLCCGPTGSGKTTTLYSCLREIDVEQRNAITIEDPVEYYLEGCTQIPIDNKQGNTFANILRSVLRQDPDVIFVGEIRDTETATVAMQASMTGHLVYTTVHARDSIGSIFRLLDLGVEPYLIASAMNMVLAQRLVRVLCPNCKKAVRPTPAQNRQMGHALDGVPHIYVPVGCKRCLGTGYKGRHGLFELLEVTNDLRDVILKSPTIAQIRKIADQGLFTTLAQFGYHLVAKGITSMDEVDRVSTQE